MSTTKRLRKLYNNHLLFRTLDASNSFYYISALPACDPNNPPVIDFSFESMNITGYIPIIYAADWQRYAVCRFNFRSTKKYSYDHGFVIQVDNNLPTEETNLVDAWRCTTSEEVLEGHFAAIVDRQTGKCYHIHNTDAVGTSTIEDCDGQFLLVTFAGTMADNRILNHCTMKVFSRFDDAISFAKFQD